MRNLPTIGSLRAVLNQPLAPELKTLLEDRLADTLHCGLQDHTHVLVVEAGDTEAQIIDAIGFSPLRSRIDDLPNCPDWDWIERHGGWWEILYCVGDSGHAFILLVEDDGESQLAQLCRDNQ